MKVVELVAVVKAAKPKLLGAVPEPLAARIVFQALREIGRQIEATSEGTIVVNGFGRFIVKRVQPRAAGKSTKHVIFRGAAGASGKPA